MWVVVRIWHLVKHYPLSVLFILFYFIVYSYFILFFSFIYFLLPPSEKKNQWWNPNHFFFVTLKVVNTWSVWLVRLSLPGDPSRVVHVTENFTCKWVCENVSGYQQNTNAVEYVRQISGVDTTMEEY